MINAKHIFLIFIIIQFYAFAVFSGPSFLPWNADVKIADQNMDTDDTYVHNTNISNAYSGPQGGAYFLIRFFQIFISPQDGPSCRLHPTCSAYGKIAVLRYGALVGSILAGERLVRCNPYTAPGKDPVPDRLFE